MSDSTAGSSRGREIALERRKTMSQGGKAGVNPQAAAAGGRSRPASRNASSSPAPASSVPSTARPSPAPVPSNARPVAAPAVSAAGVPAPGANAGQSSGRQAALARRQAMTRNGKAALGMARGGSRKASTLESLAASLEVDCSDMSGREICQLRRQALSQGGKQALSVSPSPVRNAPATGTPVETRTDSPETGRKK
jgi:hypothetical protein